MPKSLPYAPVYLNDLLGECIADGLGFRERGVLLTLLWIQHLSGGIPADPREIRRLIGGDARVGEIRRVLDLFFPLNSDGKRRNGQFAKARDAAERAYEARVRGGQIRAAQMRGDDSSAGRSADSSAESSGTATKTKAFPSPQPFPMASRASAISTSLRARRADLDEHEPNACLDLNRGRE